MASFHGDNSPFSDRERLSPTSETYNYVDLPDAQSVAEKSQTRLQAEPSGQEHRRLGMTVKSILAAGTIVLLTCMAFLCFLWFADRLNGNWRRIVVHNWLTRSIAITALAIRAFSSAQAVIATSMLASLLLEGQGIPAHLSAWISVVRLSNGGPILVLPKMLSDLSGRSAWTTYGVLLAFLCITSAILQFTSTLLLWDVAYGTVADFAGLSQVAYGLSARVFYQGTPPSHQPGIIDTGPILRALVPLSSSADRETLYEYAGPAFVYDARVACVVPELLEFSAYSSDYVDILSSLYLDVGQLAAGYVVGRLTYGQELGSSVTELNGDILTKEFEYNCTWTIEPTGPDAVVLCALQSGGGLYSSLDYAPGNSTAHEGSFGGNVFLVLGTVNNSAIDTPSAYTKKDVWTSRDYVYDNRTSLTMHMSLCFNSLYDTANMFNISASSQTNYIQNEPNITYDHQAVRFDVTTALTQLGASVPSPASEDRAVMKLDDRGITSQVQQRTELAANRLLSTDWTSYYMLSYANAYAWSLLGASEDTALSETESYTFCTSCPVTGLLLAATDFFMFPVSGKMRPIFSDVLTITGDPALALQAINSAVMHTVYYDLLAFNGIYGEASIGTLTTAFMPLASRGVGIVMAALALHLVLVAVTVIWFLSGTKYTHLRNTWQTVAQHYVPETAATYQDSTQEDDSTVKRRLRDRGKKGERFALRYRADQDRVALTPVSQKSPRSQRGSSASTFGKGTAIELVDTRLEAGCLRGRDNYTSVDQDDASNAVSDSRSGG